MSNSTEPSRNDFGLLEFDHVALVVANIADSRTFYIHQLGLEELSRPPFDFPGAWFKVGQALIHIIESNKHSGKAGWGDRAVERISRGLHMAYRTNDFEQALRAIDQHGIEIASGPQTRPDGAKQVYIYDPDRHLIEICSC